MTGGPEFTALAAPATQAVAYSGSAAQDHSNFDPTGKYKLKYQGAFAAVEVAIGPNDGVKSEGGCMVTMSNNVEFTIKMEGGFGASLLRCCCAGSSMFFSHFRLRDDKAHLGPRGDVLLAPPVPGEVMLLHLDGRSTWIIQAAGFLACDDSVQIKTKMLSAAQCCCGGEGLFVLEATGTGRLLAYSYGSLARYDLQPGEERKIDNGFLVAWTSGMEWSIARATKGLAATILSGEGLVAKFHGPGTVFVQTRSLKGLANALIPYLPSSGGGGGSSDN